MREAEEKREEREKGKERTVTSFGVNEIVGKIGGKRKVVQQGDLIDLQEVIWGQSIATGNPDPPNEHVLFWLSGQKK